MKNHKPSLLRGRSTASLFSHDVDFDKLTSFIDDVHQDLEAEQGGHVATYIPQLAEVNPELFGISVCDINGARHSKGDHDILFCIQSTSKPFLYCTAQTLVGTDEVHRHMGHEPSGQRFNAFVLDEHNLPHNPMINAGAMMSCAMILPEQEPAKRFKRLHSDFLALSGNIGGVHFDNGIYLSEREHADRNRALAYYMREHGAFPTGVDLERSMELYFQACSITMTTDTMSIVAATLANGGICPLTQKRVYSAEIVRNCISLMYTCGMYDYSGRFAFEMGFPAKSGVSGVVIIVIPQVMGIAVWSPRLDRLGNSVRGVEFCRRLVQQFPQVHLFQATSVHGSPPTPQHSTMNQEAMQHAFISAASRGDLEQVKMFVHEKKVDLNKGDYDGRTALHLACAEGHQAVVDFLCEEGANMTQKDRWGSTAAHELEKRAERTSSGDEDDHHDEGGQPQQQQQQQNDQDQPSIIIESNSETNQE